MTGGRSAKLDSREEKMPRGIASALAKLDNGGEKMPSGIARRGKSRDCWMGFLPLLLQIYLAKSIYLVCWSCLLRGIQ